MSHEDLEVMRRLVDYHDHIAAPLVPLADDLRRGRRRVRRNRGLIAAGVAVGLASVVAAVSFVTADPARDRPQPAGPIGLSTPLVAPRSPLDVRELGFHVEPGPRLEETGTWGLDRDLQRTEVALDGDLVVGVDVHYQGMTPELSSGGSREPVTVHDAEGTFAQQVRSDSWWARVAWEYAPDSWAVVSAGGASTPPSGLRSKLLVVAEAVRPGGETLRVPVRVGAVPESLPGLGTAHGLDVSTTGGEWTWWLSIDDVSVWATSRDTGECLGSSGEPQTGEFTYRGLSGCIVAGERLGLRLDDADVFFDYGPRPGLPVQDMKRMLSDLTVAPEDPATWFDLRTSLGG